MNGLRNAFDATGDTSSVTARLLGPLSALDAGSEQQGIMVGSDQDNYVKLAVINRNGAPGVEFYNELNGAGTTITAAVLPNAAAITAVDLALIGTGELARIQAETLAAATEDRA